MQAVTTEVNTEGGFMTELQRQAGAGQCTMWH